MPVGKAFIALFFVACKTNWTVYVELTWGNDVDAEAIERWICAYLEKTLKLSAGEVDPTAAFDDFGLDSAAAIGLVGELEDWLRIELEPTLAYDFPNTRALSGEIAAMVAASRHAGSDSQAALEQGRR
jgi:acyl carrier protein